VPALQSLLVFFLMLCVVGFWWQTYQIKHRALLAAKKHCQGLGLQLLDQSVVLSRMQLRRSASGSLQLHRHYKFEFSSTGDERYKGMVIMEGSRAGQVDVEAHCFPDNMSSWK